MSSRARDVDPGRLAHWCVEHLGSPPADEIFRSGYLSAVIGLRLADGRAVVVKVRPGAPRVAACVAVQRRLFASGYPCPEPLTGAAPFGDELATAEAYVPGGAVVNWPRRRRMLSRFANMYIRVVTRLNARDCTSGYRCWRRDVLASLPLDRFRSDGYSFLVEMLHVAASQGWRTAEVPITFVERRVGQSKLSAGVLMESMLTPWRLVATRTRSGR